MTRFGFSLILFLLKYHEAHAQANCLYVDSGFEVHLSFEQNCSIVTSYSQGIYGCNPTNTSYCPGMNFNWKIYLDETALFVNGLSYILAVEPTIIGFRNNTNDSLTYGTGSTGRAAFRFGHYTEHKLDKYYVENNATTLSFYTANVTTNPSEIVGWSVKFYIDISPPRLSSKYSVHVAQLNDAKLIPPGSGLYGGSNEQNGTIDIFYFGPTDSYKYLDVFNAGTFDYRYYMGNLEQLISNGYTTGWLNYLTLKRTYIYSPAFFIFNNGYNWSQTTENAHLLMRNSTVHANNCLSTYNVFGVSDNLNQMNFNSNFSSGKQNSYCMVTIMSSKNVLNVTGLGFQGNGSLYLSRNFDTVSCPYSYSDNYCWYSPSFITPIEKPENNEWSMHIYGNPLNLLLSPNGTVEINPTTTGTKDYTRNLQINKKITSRYSGLICSSNYNLLIGPYTPSYGLFNTNLTVEESLNVTIEASERLTFSYALIEAFFNSVAYLNISIDGELQDR
uniref:Uncharacterized protein n=1 Tax=Acrobeloides nanus TaxID=290746 RepID=A0A914CDU5_9BILA